MDALLIDQNALAHTHGHKVALGKDTQKYFSFTVLPGVPLTASFTSTQTCFVKQTTALTAPVENQSNPPKGDRSTPQ